MTSSSVLKDLRVLVVEDDFYLADALAANLEQRGAVVVGPVPTVPGALAVLAQASGIDVAILDVNLDGEVSVPVADRLRARAVPYLLATGYDDMNLPATFGPVPVCQKPMGMNALEEAVTGLLAAKPSA